MTDVSRPSRRALWLLCVLLMVAGVVIAHQRHGSSAPPPLRMTRARPTPKKKPVSATWRRDLELDAAKRHGDDLVQRFPNGQRITLTIDPVIQQRAKAFLARHEVPYGAMVMLSVADGAVLAMAAHSSAAPATKTADLCLTPWAPAASVYKLITASGLLERGVPAETSVCYHGGLRGLQRHHIIDNAARDNRCATLSNAIAKSINPVIAKLALRYLDAPSMTRWSRRFAFDRPIPFDLPVAKSHARIPRQRLERARVAAGFWHTEISPLHGALIASTVATGGELRWPRLVRDVRLPSGERVVPRRPASERVLSRATARALGRMMVATTTRGTGRRGFHTRRGRPLLGKLRVAGKTGSLSRKDPYLNYSWFVGFAPARRPEVAFAVLLGNPPRWRVKAAAGARALLQFYLARRAQKNSPRGQRVASAER